jgi:hypothetical protein
LLFPLSSSRPQPDCANESGRPSLLAGLAHQDGPAGFFVKSPPLAAANWGDLPPPLARKNLRRTTLNVQVGAPLPVGRHQIAIIVVEPPPLSVATNEPFGMARTWKLAAAQNTG